MFRLSITLMAASRIASKRSFVTARSSMKSHQALLQKNPNDVVVTLAIRTPLCRAKKGGLKDTTSDELLLGLLKGVVERSKVDPKLIEDIVVGTCHPPSPCYEARAAALTAGFPDSVPVQTINRLCGSGLMAIRSISDSISRGDIDIGIAAGCESMTSNPRPTPVFHSSEIQALDPARDSAEPMGWTSENVATNFKISREAMDQLGVTSHQRASAAQRSGRFTAEIMPFKTRLIDPALPDSPPKSVVITEDDGIRHNASLENFAKAKSAFPQWGEGKSTGPNSSQVTDGAAATVLMRRSKAEELGVEIIGKHVATTVVGVAPKYMGIGPVFAIPKVLENVGISKEDVDLWEINEAFSSMYVYCLEQLGLDVHKVNVNGGAIALGHPLGATGVRQVVTGLSELARRGQSVLCTSMCIGSGMGAAAIFVNERV